MLKLSIVALVAIALLFFKIQSSKDKTTKVSAKHHKKRLTKDKKKMSHGEFHCVEAHAHHDCCAAVEALEGLRFLPADAPTLPLEGCDQAHCLCDYVHHEDRRAGSRRTDFGFQHQTYGQHGEEEHRTTKRGRRKGDLK